MNMMDEDLISLGKTDIRISPLGIGAWEWGDKLTWGFGGGYDEEDCRSAYHEAIDSEVNFVDTAEVYGQGESERLLGQFMRESNQSPIVASKCFPYPSRLTSKSLRGALRGSLARSGLQHIDLYQMHWPFPFVRIEDWMNAMADAYEEGLIRAIGVSNYSVPQMKRAQETLAKRGLSLASNQVHYSLLHRSPERDGVLGACRAMDVTLIAYSPLEMGLLTGKYSQVNRPPFRRAFMLRRQLPHLEPVIGLLDEIGQAHDKKTAAQVALNWLICKGTLPIPGAKNGKQARDNAGALGWRLTSEELAALEKATNASADIY